MQKLRSIVAENGEIAGRIVRDNDYDFVLMPQQGAATLQLWPGFSRLKQPAPGQ
jgi:hypothetical protein